MIERFSLAVRERVPLYIILSFLFSVAVWSLWLPNFFDNNVDDAHAVSFGTPQTVRSVSSTSTSRLILHNDVFHLAFSSSSGGTLNLYTVTSSDGVTWSDPVEAFSDVSSGFGYFDFGVRASDGKLGITVLSSANALKLSQSSNGGETWTSSTIFDDVGAPGQHAPFVYDGAEDISVVYQHGGSIIYATSSDATTWATSSIADVSFTLDSESGEYGAYPVGVHVDGATVQVIYDTVTSTTGYEMIYASSTDSGATWTTTTISGDIAPPGGQIYGIKDLASAAFDTNGAAGALYASSTSLTGPTLTYDLIYARRSGGTWTKETIVSGVTTTVGGDELFPDASDLIYFSTDKPIMGYTDTNLYPSLGVNTTTLNTYNIASEAVGLLTEMSVVYVTSTQYVAVSYITGTSLQFATSALRSPDLNVVPTTTEMNIATSTDGSGIVTVTTTITDTDDDTVTLTVEHSTDGGSTWASSTLGTVSGEGGNPTTSTGSIANITNTSGGNTITFQWLSASDYSSATNTVRIRITPSESYGTGTVRTSDAFEVDNEAPSIPTGLSVTVGTTTSTLTWQDVSDATSYTVSSTAPGDNSTTSTTSTSFSGLATSTQYTYQVSATDSFGNESDFATSTSAYTLAAQANAPTISASSTTALNLTIDANGNSSVATYAVYNSTGDNYLDSSGAATTTAVYQTKALWDAEDITGLSVNTSTQFSVIARNGDGINAATSSLSTAVWTLAAQAGQPTIGTPTTTTLPITIAVNGNPAATTYAVYNDTDSNYLDANGASTSTAVYSTTSTLGANFAPTGLSVNTSYQFTVIARNGAGTDVATSTASTATYTLTTVPTSVSASGGSEQITVTWSGNGTTYYVNNTTASTNSGWISDTSHTFTGLTCATSYTVQVKARNGNTTETSYASSVSATTDACPGGGSSAPSISVPAPSIEAIEATEVDTSIDSTDVTSAPVISAGMNSGQSFSFSAGNSSHSISMNSVTNGKVSFTIQSDPIIFELAVGEEKVVDVDNDGVNDVHVVLSSLADDNAGVKVTVLEKLPVFVADNMSFSKDKNVIIRVGSIANVSYVAISEDSTFMGVSFVPYDENGVTYILSSGNGTKKLYIRVKTSSGASAIIEDSIKLVSQSYTGICPLKEGSVYKHANHQGVYMISGDCQRRPFTNEDRYFSYFTSWSDVQIVSKTTLESIVIDPRGVMPWGPLYDPQYGALVKTIDDPKVYLLLNDEKYWITNEEVFEALNYKGSWIEDVSQALLDTYTLGSEIKYVDHHPNYTLVKYEDDPKVYRLEPDSQDETKQVKRHIANPVAFEKLGFRWDRIVMIDDDEVYEEGEQLK